MYFTLMDALRGGMLLQKTVLPGGPGIEVAKNVGNKQLNKNASRGRFKVRHDKCIVRTI